MMLVVRSLLLQGQQEKHESGGAGKDTVVKTQYDNAIEATRQSVYSATESSPFPLRSDATKIGGVTFKAANFLPNSHMRIASCCHKKFAEPS